MQLCAVRSCGFLGFGRLAKYAGEPDDGHAHVRADPYGDHVLGHLLAETNAGVVALGDDIGQAVVDDDLDVDVGICGSNRPALARGPTWPHVRPR